MYNSYTLDPEDADLTMINHSLLYDANDDQIQSVIPIVRRQQQAHQVMNENAAASRAVQTASKQTRGNDRFQFAHIDQSRQQAAQEVEQILHYYLSELEQESFSSIDCHRQLITRLTDFLRPTYSSDSSKIHDLNLLFAKITSVHEKRFLEQKQRNEQLNCEVCYLKQMILTTSTEDKQLERINQMISYEEWIEMDNETRKLQNLVEAQRLRICELSQLLLGETSVASPAPLTTNDNATFVPPRTEEMLPPLRNRPTESGTSASPRLRDNVRSSDTDLLGKSLEETVNNAAADETRTVEPPAAARRHSRNLTGDAIKRCPICDERFPTIATDDEIVGHIEICSSSGARQPSVTMKDGQYDCPICRQKAVATEDDAYHKHLDECCNQNSPTTTLHPSMRICPFCQAIFNPASVTEQQFIDHVDVHMTD